MKSLVAVHITAANPDGTFSRSTPRLFWGDDADVEQLASRAGSAIRHDAHLSSVRTPQDLSLGHGPHPFRSNGLSITEVLAMMAGETHTNQPTSASPVLSAFAERVGQRQKVSDLPKFIQVIMEMVGSNCVLCENERTRTLLRQSQTKTVPHALRSARFTEAARKLQSCDEIGGYDWRAAAGRIVADLDEIISNTGSEAPQDLVDTRLVLSDVIEAGNWSSHYIGLSNNATSSPMASRTVGQKCADAAVGAGLTATDIIDQMRAALSACSHRVASVPA